MSNPNDVKQSEADTICEFFDGDASEECLDQLELNELMDELGFSYLSGC